MQDYNNVSIDELDYAILNLLQEDGRKSFTNIAKALGIAVGTVRNRVTKMLEDGTMRIYARINPHRVGFNAPATIDVVVQPQHLEQAILEIAKFPEVSYLAIVTGEHNLVVDVMCRDGNHLAEFLVHRLPKVIGVTTIKPHFVLRIHKFGQPDLHLIKPGSISLNDIR